MLKTIFSLITAVVMVCGLAVSAHADLVVLGTDSLGNQLIYDEAQDITWYDYTNAREVLYDQLAWADALTVAYGGTIYEDWRLPSVLDLYGNEPDPGYNVTDSEMGHLYYTMPPEGLGNVAYGPLSNTDPFINLLSDTYWMQEEYGGPLPPGAPHGWAFDTSTGELDYSYWQNPYYAMAVHPGRLAAPVPEPGTILLLGSGLVGLAGFRRKFRK